VSVEGKLLFWWLLFGATHMIGSSVPVRTFLIRTLTLRGFKAIYSVVALATFIPLVRVYFANVHAGELLFDISPARVLTCQILMLLALIVLGQGLAAKSPMTTLAELTGNQGSGATGILRITRHPQNLAFGLFGIAHGIANPYVGDLIFFGGFPVYAALSAAHQDARMRATAPEPVRLHLETTSAMPFAAILAGKQRLALNEYSWVALAGSVAAFWLLWTFHGALFG
jgi:uncharacterized membrane protein